MNDKPAPSMGNRPYTALEAYERDISVKSLVDPADAPVLKMEGTATIASEDISEDVLRRSNLKLYSLHIVDFPREETIYMVGDDIDELVRTVAEMWPDYEVEFCTGVIWRNDTGIVVGDLVEDEDLSRGVWFIDGAALVVPGDDREVEVG